MEMRITPPDINPTFTVDQVATYYLLGTDNLDVIRRWIRDGKLGAVKIGREYRVAATDIREFNMKYKKARKLDK